MTGLALYLVSEQCSVPSRPWAQASHILPVAAGPEGQSERHPGHPDIALQNGSDHSWAPRAPFTGTGVLGRSLSLCPEHAQEFRTQRCVQRWKRLYFDRAQKL